MIAIIDYRAGNLTSVRLACESIGVDARITDQADTIRRAERVIFPGVGAAGAAMRSLHALGLVDPVLDSVRAGTPFLGICLGTQILLTHSEEDGGVDTLDLIPGTVTRFRPVDRYDKVPHMGWNSVRQTMAHPVFADIADESEFYFVHSYYPAPTDAAVIAGTATYAGVTFAAAVGRDNLIATQFHPEKSGHAGLRLLRNFCHWTP